MKPIDKAIAILGASNDGDDLIAIDLKICELAANGRLSEKGLEALDFLHKTVIAGEYVRSQDRWLHGIEHLTQDNDGYVLWRGARVEHYTFSDRNAEREAALQLAESCRSLEARGLPVNSHTATSPVFKGAPPDTPWLEAMLHLYAIFPDKDGKPKWAIFASGQDAVAIGRDGNGTSVRVYHENDHSFATHDAYRDLKPPEISHAKRMETYDALTAAFGAIGITPDLVARARAELDDNLFVPTEQAAPCSA